MICVVFFHFEKNMFCTEILIRKVELWIFSLVSLWGKKTPQNKFFHAEMDFKSSVSDPSLSYLIRFWNIRGYAALEMAPTRSRNIVHRNRFLSHSRKMFFLSGVFFFCVYISEVIVTVNIVVDIVVSLYTKSIKHTLQIIWQKKNSQASSPKMKIIDLLGVNRTATILL